MPAAPGCAAGRGLALACTDGRTSANEIASNAADRELRGFTAPPGLEGLPGTATRSGGGAPRWQLPAQSAMCASLRYSVTGGSLLRCAPLMEDIPRYVRGVGFAEPRKYCYRYFCAHHRTASNTRKCRAMSTMR